MRKINALCRKAGLVERASRRILVTAVAILGVFPAAQCSDVVDAPLAHCWKKASTRLELTPCLGRLQMP